MDKLNFLNNFSDAVCALSKDNEVIFKNSNFINEFSDYTSFEKFKKRFNFNLCFLSYENIKKLTPLDILIKSKENFHTICSYQKPNEDYNFYYINKYIIDNYTVIVFKDVTSSYSYDSLKVKYDSLINKYNEVKELTDKYSKLQEHAQSQVLKMGIINRISLVIRETNDIETVLSSALNEIHNFTGSFKTYFSMKEKNSFRIKYVIPSDDTQINILTQYDNDTLSEIKNKNISVSVCKKEYMNSEEFLSDGVNRVIIPVYNKNKLLGIIVVLTKQRFIPEENKEVLQSISVHLSSSIIQAGLISQLNKKNKKLEKTLNELKETQIQLINSEKMASVGQLVSGVAHEINTPLAAINSNNKMIEKILTKNVLDKKHTDILKELNLIDIEATGRISNIVKSLKRFVRLDEAQFQSADINNEINLTLKLLEHEFKDDITVVKEFSDLPKITCSVNMLNQVFMNLIINSCHSIREKGIKGIITIKTMVKNDNLIVKIIDNGNGIPLSNQNKIFNVGFTTKKTGIGTGLGLSISKKIVELHKGTITFSSKQSVGTEFTVTIPNKI